MCRKARKGEGKAERGMSAKKKKARSSPFSENFGRKLYSFKSKGVHL